MRLFRVSFVGLFLIELLACSDSPQQADPGFILKNTHKIFSKENSPVVFVDGAYNKFLTANGRYRPSTQVLESNGYTVKPNRSRFSSESLNSADVLVIANALDKSRRNWSPPFNEALTNEEFANVKKWVLKGGSLLLIADHTPFTMAIDNLASEFGF